MSARHPLWPREHGAYAQLAAPLATALALRAPGPAALALAAAACLAFLANEPLLVVLGHRGARLRATHGPRAARRLALTAIGAAVCGAVGLVLAPREALAVAGLAAVPTALVLALAWRRAVHSLAGELAAAVALPGAAAPIAVASGLGWRPALVLWAGWAVGFGCSVAAVHRVIAHHRRPAPRLERALAAAFGATAGAGLALAASVPLAVTAVPLAAVSTVLVAGPPPARRLRAIGVALVIASLASGAVAVALG